MAHDGLARVETAFDEAARPEDELRAKPVVRRSPIKWVSRDDTWQATIGRWSVRVGESPVGNRWEWRAFACDTSRAVGGGAWPTAEQAQHDAEATLAMLPLPLPSAPSP